MTQSDDGRRILSAKGKSFALAGRWLEASLLDDAAALYAWCRRADDLIDVPGSLSPDDALQRLRRELDGIYAGTADHPRNSAFRRVVAARRIPKAYPLALLEGFAMDVRRAPYETLRDLLVYCHHVAGTVGLMMAHVLGLTDGRQLARAAHLGIAMQLTNVCRDVAEDWSRGRMYVPRELLSPRFGEQIRDPGVAPLDTELRKALARATGALISEAKRWYASADRALHALPFRCALAVRTARRVYAEIGGVVVRNGCDPCASRAVVPRRRKIAIAVRSLAQELLERVRHAPAPCTEPLPLSVLESVDDVLRL
jgi:15-cis-phytoene synthase